MGGDPAQTHPKTIRCGLLTWMIWGTPILGNGNLVVLMIESHMGSQDTEAAIGCRREKDKCPADSRTGK